MNIKVLIFSYANILRLLLFSFLSNSAPNPADATDTSIRTMPARDYTLWNPPCKSLPNTISISRLFGQDQSLCFDLKKGIQKNLKIMTPIRGADGQP